MKYNTSEKTFTNDLQADWNKNFQQLVEYKRHFEIAMFHFCGPGQKSRKLGEGKEITGSRAKCGSIGRLKNPKH